MGKGDLGYRFSIRAPQLAPMELAVL